MIAATGPLEDFPEMGVPRPDLGDGLRSLSVGEYLIFYRRRSVELVVERILHGRLDINRDIF